MSEFEDYTLEEAEDAAIKKSQIAKRAAGFAAAAAVAGGSIYAAASLTEDDAPISHAEDAPDEEVAEADGADDPIIDENEAELPEETPAEAPAEATKEEAPKAEKAPAAPKEGTAKEEIPEDADDVPEEELTVETEEEELPENDFEDDDQPAEEPEIPEETTDDTAEEIAEDTAEETAETLDTTDAARISIEELPEITADDIDGLNGIDAPELEIAAPEEGEYYTEPKVDEPLYAVADQPELAAPVDEAESDSSIIQIDSSDFFYDENGNLVSIIDTGNIDGQDFAVIDTDGDGLADRIAVDLDGNHQFDESEYQDIPDDIQLAMGNSTHQTHHYADSQGAEDEIVNDFAYNNPDYNNHADEDYGYGSTDDMANVDDNTFDTPDVSIS